MGTNSLHSPKLTSYLAGLLLLVYPFGPALQNLGMGLFIVIAATIVWTRKSQWRPNLLGSADLALASLLIFLLWNVLVTLLNSDNHDQEKTAYLLGYLPLIVIPWLGRALPKLGRSDWDGLFSLSAFVVLLWGAVAASQHIFPWHWVGAQFVSSGIGRAQGFYSHPMSLAYASLLFWPFAIRMILAYPKKWQSWFFAIGTGLLLVYSMSRIAQVLVAIFSLWNIAKQLSGRRRLQVLAVALVLASILAITNNPVSQRFRHLLQADRSDRSSHYADDRLVFWQAHLLMIKDRPWFGFGIHLDLDFRKPFYSRLGMQDFSKQYQAHNQYLQISAEGGLIALAFYFCWVFFGRQAIKKSHLGPLHIETAWQCMLIFLLGCLTQNAFDDSTVRTGLVILWLLVFLNVPAKKDPVQAS